MTTPDEGMAFSGDPADADGFDVVEFIRIDVSPVMRQVLHILTCNRCTIDVRAVRSAERHSGLADVEVFRDLGNRVANCLHASGVSPE